MKDCQKGHLWQVGPDEEIGEDKGREKDYRDEASLEKWPKSAVRHEIDEALCSSLEGVLKYIVARARCFTLNGYSQLASQMERTGLYCAIMRTISDYIR